MRLNLKIAMLTTGKSQRQVAWQSGISENRLSQIVQGWVEPTQREQTAIAAALREAPENLFPEKAGAPESVSAVEVS